jgi:hypothetical protein
MTNKKLFWGMLVTVLTFGLVLVGCPTESDDNGGGETFPAETRGKITITGIPVQHDDKYMWVVGTVSGRRVLWGLADLTG